MFKSKLACFVIATVFNWEVERVEKLFFQLLFIVSSLIVVSTLAYCSRGLQFKSWHRQFFWQSSAFFLKSFILLREHTVSRISIPKTLGISREEITGTKKKHSGGKQETKNLQTYNKKLKNNFVYLTIWLFIQESIIIQMQLKMHKAFLQSSPRKSFVKEDAMTQICHKPLTK